MDPKLRHQKIKDCERLRLQLITQDQNIVFEPRWSRNDGDYKEFLQEARQKAHTERISIIRNYRKTLKELRVLFSMKYLCQTSLIKELPDSIVYKICKYVPIKNKLYDSETHRF